MLFHSKLECGALGPEFHRDPPPERSLCVLYVFPELQGEIRVLCVPAKLPVGGKDCFGISSADFALFEPSFTGGRGAHRLPRADLVLWSRNWCLWLLSPGAMKGRW